MLSESFWWISVPTTSSFKTTWRYPNQTFDSLTLCLPRKYLNKVGGRGAERETDGGGQKRTNARNRRSNGSREVTATICLQNAVKWLLPLDYNFSHKGLEKNWLTQISVKHGGLRNTPTTQNEIMDWSALIHPFVWWLQCLCLSPNALQMYNFVKVVHHTNVIREIRKPQVSSWLWSLSDLI